MVSIFVILSPRIFFFGGMSDGYQAEYTYPFRYPEYVFDRDHTFFPWMASEPYCAEPNPRSCHEYIFRRRGTILDPGTHGRTAPF